MPESNLNEFPPVPNSGSITAAEYGAQMISIPSNPDDPVDGDKFCDRIASYRKINSSNLKPIFQHKIPPVRTAGRQDSLLISKNEGAIKGMWDACRDSGIRGLQNYLRQTAEKNPAVSVLYGCLAALASITDALYKLKNEVMVVAFPHLGLALDTTIQNASQVRNWKKAWLRAVAWHPDSPKLAFALQDDSVRLCEMGEEAMPLLRCPEQKNISSVSWRPYTHFQLAVGVDTGIIIWELETANNIKPGASQSRFLSVKGHAPVTSVEYSYSGLLLLSSSSYDTTIYVWDVSTWNNSPLYRLGGGGVPFSSWSPADDKILSTSPETIFRIWERHTRWVPRRWDTPKLPIESACWSPDSTTLLFASGGMIYALHFMVNAVETFIHNDKFLSVPLYDISDCAVLSEDEQLQYKVGGRVRKMDMDPSGNRLAVCFDDSELIAVFRVQPKSLYYLAPCGFIRGFPDEYPLTITFQKNFKDGALLTIAWNSGRIQYFPFLFAGGDSKKNLLHEENYRMPSAISSTAKGANSKSRRSMSGIVFGEKDGGIGGGGDNNHSRRSLNSSSSKTASLFEETSDEDVIVPNTSFRTTSFLDAPKSNGFDYTAHGKDEAPRLFSLEHRSPI